MDEIRMMMKEDKEVWKPLKEFPSYSVSSYGRVSSHLIRERDTKGRVIGWVYDENTRTILTPKSRKSGDLQVSIHCKHYLIHRLVASVFWENNDPNKNWVDHIDRDRTNNHAWNLRWCSAQENCLNSKLKSTNTSGYKGVCFHKNSGWYAQWVVDGTSYTKTFDTKEEAIDYRKQMVDKFYNPDFYTQN